MPPSIRGLCAAATVTSALALAACATVGPDFTSPVAPAAPGYAMVGDHAAPGVSLMPDTRAAGPWWKAFGSPQLDATIREALANNPSVAEARANLEKAQAQLAATTGEAGPAIERPSAMTWTCLAVIAVRPRLIARGSRTGPGRPTPPICR
jgi:hypothetical protein